MRGLYSLVSGLCLVLMFVLYLRMINKVARSEKRDNYIQLLLVAMVYLAGDVMWGVIYDELLVIPIVVQRIIYSVYYMASAMVAYQWFFYVEYMQNSKLYKDLNWRYLTRIPMIFVVVVSIISFWTGTFFYIDDAGVYCRGPWYVLQLVLTYGYILFAAGKLSVKMFMEKDFETQNTYMIMISYFMFPVVFGILQIMDADAPFLCIGIAMATLQTYLFYVTYESERTLSASKIHSLSRLFMGTYYLDLDLGKREYLSNSDIDKKYLTGSFYKNAPEEYEDSIRVYVDKFVHPDDKEVFLQKCNREYMINHLSEDNLAYSFNYRQIASEEEKWYNMYVIASSFKNSGEIASVITAVMDVDAQVRKDIRQKEVVEEALVQAEKANQAKSNFLSSMSHDIRTPMNAIMGFTSLAQRHVDETNVVDAYLEKIHSAGEHLLSLINDILDMSRIESGRIQIQEDEVSLKEMLHDVENMILPMAEEQMKKFIIRTNITNNYVYCDKLRLNQILINLLGNAVKFTPERGQITLDITQEMIAPPGYGVYIFKVKDTGIGIAKEFHEKIFDAFEREKAPEQSGIQGSGLGLAITKNLVKLMGGKISLDSEIGKGTEFTVKLVFTLQDVVEDELALEEKQREKARLEAESQAARKELFSKCKLLLVDDNAMNRQIARLLLKEEGFTLEEAVNGREAVERIRSSEVGEFDLVLMDIQMPIMDGYEATKEIRALPSMGHRNIPIIAMTANAFEEEKKKALNCGMNGHVSKPIDINLLFKTIEGILK